MTFVAFKEACNGFLTVTVVRRKRDGREDSKVAISNASWGSHIPKRETERAMTECLGIYRAKMKLGRTN